MPRISAPTVAEHHARKRAEIIGVAVDLLATGGPPAVTPSAAAQGAGLARSSVYQYFPSTSDLMAAAVEETFRRVLLSTRDRVHAAPDPRSKLTAYLDITLDHAVTGHLPTMASASADLDEALLQRLMDWHREGLEPLATALTDLGVSDPATTAALISGAVSAAANRINHGAARGATRAELQRFVHAAVG